MMRFAASKLLGVASCQIKQAAAAGTCESVRVAVVLSGCGVYDGSEIHESAHVLSALTRNNAVPIIFAPDGNQMHVVNHLRGEPDASQHERNILVESARIARGKISPLKELVNNMKQIDAVIFPGGFGVAKNLSDFAVKGPNCTVHPEVVAVIQGFHRACKPMGFICIAPILAARVLCNPTITLGKDLCDGWPHRDAIKAAKEMGAIVESKEFNETSYDRENNIYSTPAYMYDGKFHEIDDSIRTFVQFMLLNMKVEGMK